jgi:hypothetical protein
LIRWLEFADEDRLFLSVITLAELRYGVERMAPGARRSRLDKWVQFELPERFNRRIVSIDPQVAEAWGKVVAGCESLGQPIAAMDAFLAAIVRVHDFTLVTHNIRHFPTLKAVLDPWT